MKKYSNKKQKIKILNNDKHIQNTLYTYITLKKFKII